MTSTKEPQWISVNNNALEYFEGVPLMVVFDSCKLAVIANNARNKNAYVMGSDAYELDHLLSKSSDLAKNSNKGGDRK